MPDRSRRGVLALALMLAGSSTRSSAQTPLAVANHAITLTTQRSALQQLILSSDAASAVVDASDAKQFTQGVMSVIASHVNGLEVFQDSTGARIRISPADPRGLKNSLFVIDGVPLAQGFAVTILSKALERIDVFQDSASTKPYGVRPENGVVIIATARAH